MDRDDAGSSPDRSPRPAGKQLLEKRKGFLIYLPPTLHAKLKLEAIKRAVSMSEVATTAVAQFLSDAPWREVQTPLAPAPPGPFVGSFGGERPGPKAEAQVPDIEVPTGPVTYEVE